MKRFFKVILGCAVLLFFAYIKAFLPINAAETKVKPNEENYCDLNGDGKNEKIVSKFSDENLKIYINDKLAFDSSDTSMYFYGYAEINITDINPSDKSKEIVIEIWEDGDDVETYVFRYKKNKLELLFQCYYDLLPEQKKGNKVLVYDSASCALGNTFTIVRNCKIKNKELVEIKPKSQTYTVYDNRYFTTAKKITVYKSSDGKQVDKTINPGAKIRLKKIKYVDNTIYGKFIIKDKKKSTGWINISFYEGCEYEDKLVTQTNFAG